jgi:hypothetical protein
MEFRLTYDGPLFSTQRDPEHLQRDKNADHKHDLRRRFHKQLKRLWKVTPYLSNVDDQGRPQPPHLRTETEGSHDIETLSTTHSLYGFHFVPLVTHAIEVFCGLDILFLRPDKPGQVLWAGDIDNRIKTLIDALRIPTANERYDTRRPSDDETPFFVLLEEDQLVTKLSVETDQLLEFSGPESMSEVRLLITVRVRPSRMHMGNLEFGG